MKHEEEEEPIEVGNINTGYLINAEGVIYGLQEAKK